MPTDDYIKRSDALKALSRGSGCDNICSRAIKRIPAADVEPRRESGVWIEQPETPNVKSNKIYRCSVCGYADEHSPTTEVPYCWHCGSRMRKMQKEEDNGSVQ